MSRRCSILLRAAVVVLACGGTLLLMFAPNDVILLFYGSMIFLWMWIGLSVSDVEK